MIYLLFALLPIIGTTKETAQSYVSRNYVKNFKDNLFLNLLIFFVAAIIFSIFYVRGLPNYKVIIYALIFAVSSIVFQFCYSLALKYGSFAITSTLMSFSIVIQVLTGLLLYSEKLNIFNYVSFFPLAASMVLMGAKQSKESNEENKNRTRWIIFTILAFVGNAATTIVQIVFSHEPPIVRDCQGEFVAWSYILSFGLMLPILIVSLFFNKEQPLYKIDFKNSLAVIIAGGTLAAFNFLTTLVLSGGFPASIFFPVRSGITIIVLFIVDILFYKVKIKPLQWIGALFAIIAIIFLSI